MRRRRFLTGATTAVGALLAGCTGGSSEGAGGENGSGTTAVSGTGTTNTTESTANSTNTSTSSGGSYSVSIAPVGEVTFEGVPETWVANNGSWADMGTALGVEPPEALWLTNRYHTQYYDAIPGVSVDKSGMQDLYSDGVSKELFYQLDGDVHVMDPNFLLNRYNGWERADVNEISENIAPFFGNSIFSRGYGWHEGYRYYTLYEAFGKLAQVFRRESRYEQFRSLHDEVQSRISNAIPPEGERPAVAILWASGDQPDSFSPYIISEGTSFKQWRDLGVRDALAETDVQDFHSTRASVSYETLLEIDPDVLLLRGQEEKTADEFQNTIRSFLEGHDTASRLTAVENGDVYRGGPLYQGPITNLVLTERAINQVYPDRAPDRLFDPARVARIVRGDG